MATQYGTIKLQTQNNGVVEVPVWDPADVKHPYVRVQTPSGVGALHLEATTEADYPYLRVQTQNNGVLAVSNTVRETVIADGFEDGGVTEYTLNDDLDGQDYKFVAQTTDSYNGSYAGEQYLKGSGGNAVYTETWTLNQAVSEPIASWAFKQWHSYNGNSGYEASARLLVNCDLADGTTETITYMFGSVERTDTNASTEDATALHFVVSGVGNAAWTTTERNIDNDLSAGGYANATAINSISWEIVTPGTGGGSDEIGVRFDKLDITST